MSGMYEISESVTGVLLGEDGIDYDEGKKERLVHDKSLSGDICASTFEAVSDALMAKISLEDNRKTGQHRDLGRYEESITEIKGQRLASQEASILHDVREKIGSGQDNAIAISFAPSWVVEKSMKAENEENWAGSYEEAMES